MKKIVAVGFFLISLSLASLADAQPFRFGKETLYEAPRRSSGWNRAENRPAVWRTATPFSRGRWDKTYSQNSFWVGPKVSLFNGTDLTGWTDFDGKAPSENWVVEDGAIYKKGKSGDLYTAKEYENFILEFEFKIEKGANSGLKYKSWRTTDWGMGCEYQIYDDASSPDQKPQYRTASLYDVYEPAGPVNNIKIGEYNKGKIVVMGNYVEHWLNGVRTVSATIDSPEWKARVAKSKFAEEKNFGHVAAGRLFLQDHGSPVWFRNLYLTELTPAGR